jgi:excinuclease ABC subunit B
VAILDADKEGYLRSERSLIQTIGRAARNVNGMVLMYADSITESMRRAIDETLRRRRIQSAYNTKHNITPQSVRKALTLPLVKIYEVDYAPIPTVIEASEEYVSPQQLSKLIEQTRKEMQAAAAALEFEQAATLRDRLQVLERRALGISGELGNGGPTAAASNDPKEPIAGSQLSGTSTSRATRTSPHRGTNKAISRGRRARWQK